VMQTCGFFFSWPRLCLDIADIVCVLKNVENN
jgi:hypothetical protein